MPSIINKYTDIIHIQSEMLMSSNQAHLGLAQRQAIELINRYSMQLATIAKQVTVNENEYDNLRHELINLLTPIVGYVEMLSDGWIGVLDSDQQAHIEIIHHSVNDLRDTILKHHFQDSLSESA